MPHMTPAQLSAQILSQIGLLRHSDAGDAARRWAQRPSQSPGQPAAASGDPTPPADLGQHLLELLILHGLVPDEAAPDGIPGLEVSELPDWAWPDDAPRQG